LRALIFPTVTSKTSEGWLRLYHSVDITHFGDTNPVFIAAGGDITATSKLLRNTVGDQEASQAAL